LERTRHGRVPPKNTLQLSINGVRIWRMSAAAGIRRGNHVEAERTRQLVLLEAVIANIRDAVLAETESGEVVAINTAFRRIFGLSSSTRSRALRSSLVPHVQQFLADASVWPPRRSALEAPIEAELKLVDGRVLEARYSPVTLDNRRTIRLWQFRDVTAPRQSEAELLASRHRLRELSTHLEGVREEERRDLARALHDEIGQLLTGVRLEVASAVEKFHSTRTSAEIDVVDRLQAAVGLIDLSIATVRRITTALRPPMLDHLGLVATIRWEAALFERRTGIRCRVTASPAAFETREHLTVLYRILLEALTNVARHANAGTVWIQVRRRPRRLTMEVRDNGRGIQIDAAASPTTLGLLGMRERALAAKGDLRVTRLPAGGTSVLVSVPLDSTETPSPVGRSHA
jgi:signal transduction histidine kinase